MKQLVIIFCILLVISSFGQSYNKSLLSNKDFQAADSGSLKLRINSASFFKNNEFFNYISEGYTNIGYFLQPVLVYTAFPNLQFEAGGHFLNYSGLKKFHQNLPIFRAHYFNHKGFHFIMGTLYGTLNHKLIEPLYRFEHFFEKNLENGLQLIFNKKHYNLEIWMDWEQFIFHNDPFQEQIAGGHNLEINLLKNDNWQISIPFQSTIYHEGGQIDKTDKKDLLLVNTASGIGCERKLNSKFFNSISVNSYYISYNDFSDEKISRYLDGSAYFSNVYLKTKVLNILAGYWSGQEYFSSKGEPLFNAVSEIYTSYFEPEKDLFLLKFIFEKKIYEGVLLGIRIETYHGFIQNQTDFSYGVHLLFNRDFFLVKESQNQLK